MSSKGSEWIKSPEAMAAVEKLVEDIRRRPALAVAWAWPNPALNVIDCVVSLKNHYQHMVFPRVKNFKENHPDITTLHELRDLMLDKTPYLFGKNELDYDYEARMNLLFAVVEKLIELVPEPLDCTELSKWANSAKCGDERSFGVKGFGPAGFQYLRILFGAQTFKPDMHILAYVKDVTGLTPAPNDAVDLLAKAATQANVAARDLDHTIWLERSGATTQL